MCVVLDEENSGWEKLVIFFQTNILLENVSILKFLRNLGLERVDSTVSVEKINRKG